MPVVYCKCGEVYLFEDYTVPATYWCNKCGEEVPVSSSRETGRISKQPFKVLPVLAALLIVALITVLILFVLKPKKGIQARQKTRGNSSAFSNTASKSTPPSGPTQTETYTTPPLVLYGGAETVRLPLGSSPLGEGVRGGLSTLTVENKTEMDALIRVLRYRSNGGLIRNFYIPSGSKYTAEEIPPGKYFLRVEYGRIWSSSEGGFSPELLVSESKPFNITEKKTSSGTGYSQMTITLSTVLKD